MNKGILDDKERTQIIEELTKQLILMSNSSPKLCTDFLDESNKQNNEISEWNKAISRITKARTNLEDFTFLYASIFLSVYEMTYVAHLDRICLMLIKNGHDLYDPIHNKFAKNFNDIGKLSTFIKFQFLREHGLEALILEKDNELRNKIAHSDFTIEETGKINVQNKTIDLNERLLELYRFSTEIVLALNKAVNNLTIDLNRRTDEINKKTEELNRKNKH